MATAGRFVLREFLADLVVVEREEAAAKEIRLKWITEERNRIRVERLNYESELRELKQSLPDPIKPRAVPPAVAKSQEREMLAFNSWTKNNDPQTTRPPAPIDP